MSLVKTLAKVAIGVAIAKGVSHVAKNGLPGAAGTAQAPNAGRGTRIDTGAAPGGLGDMMGDLLAGGPSAKTTRRSGGSAGGGLGDLLDQLAGGGQTRGTATRTTTRRTQAPSGGLEDLLKGMTGGGAAGGAGGGGLGDLLGGLLGGAMGGTTAARGGAGGLGGLGSLFDEALQGREPQATTRDQELAAALMLKAMIQAAKCDGKLDAAEKKKLTENLGDASEQEIAFVNAELASPVDVEGLARQVPEGMEQQVYLMSLMAIDLDSRNEAQYLHELAQALGLDPREVNAIHDHAGAPRLYS